MKKNLGTADRIIRFVIAIVLADMAVSNPFHRPWNIIVWVIIGILSITAVLSFCPLYSLLGIRTNTSHRDQKLKFRP